MIVVFHVSVDTVQFPGVVLNSHLRIIPVAPMVSISGVHIGLPPNVLDTLSVRDVPGIATVVY